jgi:hypothetical protein
MISLFVIFLAFQSFQAHAQMSAETYCGFRSMSDELTRIERASSQRTVYSDIKAFEKRMRGCGRKLSDFGVTEDQMTIWMRRGDVACSQHVRSEFSDDELKDPNVLTRAISEVELWYGCAKRLGLEGADSEYAQMQERFKYFGEARRAKCTAIDNTNIPALAEHRDQGNIGWCYAHSAADLASVALGQRISAVDLAMSYNDGWLKNLLDWQDTSLQGGYMGPTIDTGNETGYCLEENLRSDDSGRSSWIELYRTIEDNRRRGYSDNPRDLDSVYNLVKVVAPKMSKSDFIEVYTKGPANTFFKRFRDKACQPRIMKRVITSSTYGSSDGVGIVRGIDKALESGGVSSWGFKYQCGYYGEENVRQDGHAVTVVKRRWNEQKGRCEYYMRNSWGPDRDFWVTEDRIFNCTLGTTNLILPTETSIEPHSIIGHH